MIGKIFDLKIESENSFGENFLNNVQLLKRYSVSKSKLPPSHFPDAQDKESESSKLVEKLQAIVKIDTNKETEEKESFNPKINKESPLPEPKFLVIDTTEEELEELARIDAELEQTNNVEMWTSDEESTLVSLIKFKLIGI